MDESRPTLELGPESLRRSTDHTQLPFETTATLAPPDMMVGQERAREAISLALDAPDGHYNLYVSGLPGTGRTDATVAQTRAVASQRYPTIDWVYVYNFETPEEPLALEIPAGRGRLFAHEVDNYLISYRRELRRAFSSDVYEQQSAALITEPLANRNKLLEALSAEARSLGFDLRGTPSGYVIAPLAPTEAGSAPQPLTEEAFDALPDAEKEQIQASHDRVEAAIAKVLPQVRAVEDEARGLVRTLDHEVADTAGRHLSEQLAATYATFPAVLGYLQKLRADIVAHARVLIAAPTESQLAQSEEMRQDGSARGESAADATDTDGLPKDDDLRGTPALRTLARRYGVNVMVAHAQGATAPVVVETSPTYANLTGRIDIGIRDGLPFTDHMMLKPGAMHKAVGGFLILQAYDVLTQPRSWEAVKRMVRFERIEIENTSQPIGNDPGATIRPRPIRADLKVILVGDPHTYAELAALDPEFRQNFKVRADFDYDMPRDAVAEQAYAALAGQTARSFGSPDFTNDAVALVIEEGSRWVEDQERLSTQLADVRDLCVEAGYFAKRDKDTLTRRSHVELAIRARERMRNMEAVRLQQEILRQDVMISTQGAAVGQINGLYVREILGYEFGMPARITATVSPGLAGVVTVDREADLSGPTHTKGVLVLAGYLAGHFAEEFPLSLSASLSFEQTYHGVDGDSASSAELYALLSALADLPIKQTLAVTGSVNQRGETQAIGGATHKVEGFFHICQQRGLTGDQGVIIPHINARNLMLREDVVEAVRAGKFHIYGVSTIDEGIQLLTGIPFGTKTSDGRYLEGTVAARVLHRLRAYSTLVQRYSFGVRGDGMRG